MTLSNRLKGIILAVGGSIFWGILSALAAACYTVSPRWLLMRWPSAHRDAILSLAYICLLGTAISFWAYISSTKFILPQEASILNAMEPLASIVFSVLLLDVLFQLPEIAGTILIILPILYITTRKNK